MSNAPPARKPPILNRETKQKLVLMAADIIGALSRDDLREAHAVSGNLDFLIEEAYKEFTNVCKGCGTFLDDEGLCQNQECIYDN